MNRRDFIKNTAIASAASVAGLSVPRPVFGAQEEEWKWDKAVCRFCGTGCGIMIARKDGKIVAIKGDPAAPVNRGLNCIKGYFNAKIMYGEDRLVMPLLRMNDKENLTKKENSSKFSGKEPLMKWKNNLKKPTMNSALQV